jgi:hypothetical protein
MKDVHETFPKNLICPFLVLVPKLEAPHIVVHVHFLREFHVWYQMIQQYHVNH